MKILASFNPNKPTKIGLLKAFESCGHNIYSWDTQNESAFDVFDKFQPEILITHSQSMNRELENCLIEYPWVRVYNIDSLMDASDIFLFIRGQYQKELASDIAFYGDEQHYQSKPISEYINPLLHPVGKYNIKIGGDGWGCVQRIGILRNEHIKDFLASSKVCLNVDNSISELPFNIAVNKCFCISNRIKLLEDKIFTNEEIVFADNPQDFEDLINHFLKYPNERLPYIERAYKTVMSKHTYFHRVSDVFKDLDLPHHSKHVMKVYKRIVEENKLL